MAYRFDLINSSDMSAIAQLNARSRSFDLTLNRPGTARFTLAIGDKDAASIVPVSTAIRIIRDDVVLWSGPVWTLNSDAADQSIEVGCVGWVELLNYRVIRSKLTYTAQTSGFIIDAVLDHVNAQTDGSTVRPTYLTATGAVGPTRTRTYEVGQKLWPIIQELCDIENGVDFSVDPTTRVINVVAALGSTRPEVKFGYNTWPNNLLNVLESYDTPRTANRISVKGQASTVVAQDTAAMNTLGQMFEDSLALNDVTDAGILAAYAGAEVVYRKTPLRQFQIFPEPYRPNVGVPQPFVDYGMGDTVYFSVDEGRLQVVDQALRIFGISIAIDDEDNESVTSLRVVA